MVRKKVAALSALSAVLYGCYSNPTIVKAEGSVDLIKNGGYRPYLLSSSTKMATIPLQTHLKVYAKQGEKIYLGSSACGRTDDIIVKDPSGTQITCDILSSGKGYINTLAKESSGPSITSGDGGYTPIIIDADQTGIWEVEFAGSGRDSQITSSLVPTFTRANSTDDQGFVSNQKGQVAAWDITVIDPNEADINKKEKKGRVFTSYIALYMGGNSSGNAVLNSDFYVLTKDGYQYKTSMNGIDPNGFIFFSNNRGFIDKTSSMTLYHSANSGDDNLTTIQGNVSPQLPTAVDTSTDITHNVFINKPNDELPQDTLPTTAIPPAKAMEFTFQGAAGGSLKSVIGEGGTFSFNSDKVCSYKLIIDTNKDGIYNSAVDRVIENVATVGTNTVVWDGKDASGNTLPIGDYSAQIAMKGGEYHFPLLDAEYNAFGIKVELLNPPSEFPTGINKNTVYYDDRDYKTSNGTSVNLNASASGLNPVNGLGGVDSSTGAHAFVGTNGGYGNWKGIDTWTYFPGNVVTLSFKVVEHANAVPTVSDIIKSGLEGSDITFTASDFTDKFTDADKDSLSKIKITSLPATGTLKLNGAEVKADDEISVSDLDKLTFTPYENWSGNTSFGWNGNDGTVYATTPANVNITITAVNHAPVTTADTQSIETPYRTAVTKGLGVTDPDGDSLTYEVKEDAKPANGTVTIDANGNYTYIPNTGFSGTDTFKVIASDGKGQTVEITINVTVGNAAPIGETQNTETPYGTPLTDPVGATDPNGDPLTYEIKDENKPRYGSATVDTINGKYTYTPNVGFSGIDSFKITVSDGKGGTVDVLVNVTVENGVPTAAPQNIETGYGTLVTNPIGATDPNGDPLTYSVKDENKPANGTVTINEDGTYTYTPNAGFSGSDSFKVIVDDGKGGTIDVAVSITVGNGVPTAAPQNVETPYGTAITNPVGATDPNGDSLTYSIKDENKPSHGTVIVDTSGNYTYTPNVGFSGSDSFKVTVDDSKGGTIDVLVNVTVRNGVPTAAPQNIETLYGTSVTNPIGATDPNGDPLTYSVKDENKPANGTVTINEDETYTYTPNTGFSGSDSFKVTVDDGKGGTVDVLVNVTVGNGVPTAAPQDIETPYGIAVTNPVGATDPNGDELTYSVKDENKPSHGEVTISGDGTYTYTPNAGFSGSDSFKVTVDDGKGGTVDAVVNVTVGNGVPTAAPQNIETLYGTSVTNPIGAMDPNEDELTYSVKDENKPAQGTVILNEDGSYTYTPNAGFSGSDSFKVTVDDGKGGTIDVVVNVTVGNGVPTAASQSIETPYGTAVTNPIEATDPNGDLLTYEVKDENKPSHGTVTINGDGTYTYTPSTGFSGSDSFKVTVDDGKGGTIDVAVGVTVGNGVPTAAPQNIETAYGTAVTNPVGAADPNGDLLTYEVKEENKPAHGTVTLNGDGTYTYTPSTGFSGSDSFKVTVDDGKGGTIDVAVGVTVGNGVPTAAPQNIETAYGTPITNSVGASDPNGDQLTYTIKDENKPAHGTVTLNGDGTYTYTPSTGFSGSDSFKVTVDDGKGGTIDVAVGVTVGNGVPTAEPQNIEIGYGTSVTNPIGAIDPNEDLLTYEVKEENKPAHGTVTLNGDGTYTYTPSTGFSGSDSFKVTVDDGKGGTIDVAVGVTVGNGVPTAAPQNVETPYGTAVTNPVGATDPNGDQLTYTIKDENKPAHGTVTLNGDGTYTYTPSTGFSGSDSFKVTVDDGKGGTIDVAVGVTVGNGVPTAEPQNIEIGYGTSVTNPIGAIDPNGDLLTYEVKEENKPAHGTVKLNGDGTYTYTSSTGFSGSDSFKVTVDDGKGGTIDVAVGVTVGNGVPTAAPQNIETSHGTAVTNPIGATDPNGDSLTYSVKDENKPSHGTVTINGNGTYTYTPNTGFSGSDSFKVTVDDGEGGTIDVAVNVTVGNGVPKVGNYENSTTKDTAVSGKVEGTDANGDELTYTKGSDPIHGSVTVNTDGTYTYTPETDYIGDDSFKVTVSDGKGGTAESIVTIHVELGNVAPTVGNYENNTTKNTSVSGRVEGTDANGDALTYTKGSDPTHGSVTVNTDGTYTYTPVTDYVGDDSFKVTVSDGNGGTTDSAITIHVEEGNAAPTVGNYENNTTKNTAVSGKVEGTDANGDTLTYTKGTDPAHGSVMVNADGTYTYTPGTDYVGDDSFTVNVSDNNGGTTSSAITIHVVEGNAAPTLENSENNTTKNTAINGQVTGTDANGDGLTYTKGSDPVHGSVEVNADGTYTYTPETGYVGDDSFKVTVSDGKGGSAEATVTVHVAAVNGAPTAATDTQNITTGYGVPVTKSVGATDPDGDPLTYQVKDGDKAAHGTVTVDGSGNYTYTPNTGFSGTDSFKVTVSDGKGGTTEVTVNVTVGNAAPTVGNYENNTTKSTAVSGKVEGTDANGDTLTYTKGTDPAHGSVTVSADGNYTYTPQTGYVGDDSFTVNVSDNNGGTTSSAITMHVAEGNAAPTVGNYENNTTKNTAVSGKVEGTDANGDELTYTKGTEPSHGSVEVNADGGYTYTPATDYVGSDSFTVNVSDNNGGTTSSAITIHVVEGNAAPTIENSENNTTKNTAVNGQVEGTDANGDELTYTKGSDPVHGSVTVNADGTYTYTPETNYVGDDSFKVTVSDGKGGTTEATVTIHVSAVNGAPTAATDTQNITTSYGTPAAGDLGVTDPDGDSLTYEVKDGEKPAHGTVTVDGSGNYTYTPNEGFSGTDSFKVTVSDGKGGITEVTVNVTVGNAVPTVGNYENNTTKNTAVSGKVEGTDANGDTLTYTKGTDPAHGSVMVNADGTYTYTPGTDYVGDDSFTVNVSDNNGGTTSSAITIHVVEGNAAPTLENSENNTTKNTAINGQVTGTDANGDGLTYTKGSDPVHGSVEVNADGTYTYTPETGYVGDDSFKVTVSDGKGGTAESIVTIHVELGNVAPIVGNYENNTTKNTAVSGKVEGTDANGDTLTYVKGTDPAHGSVEVNADGTYTYTPETDYVGEDSFTVTVSDGKGGSAISIVKILVNPQTIGVVGTVTDQETGNVIPGCTVIMNDLSGKLIKQTTTDNSGKYDFDNVVIGKYVLVVENTKYATQNIEFNAQVTNPSDSTVTEDVKLVSYKIGLVANPSTIVGDGKSKTNLTATVLDKNGVPVEGVTVNFSADNGIPDSNFSSKTAITDKDGKATVILTSEDVSGVNPKVITIKAEVDDSVRDLHAQSQILVTFEPGSITGIVTDNLGNPIEGAEIVVSKDFNNDGITDFYFKEVTGADGTYTIAVPKGNEKYDLIISKPVQIGDSTVVKTFEQTASVGTITGTGNENYDSNKVATGLVLAEGSDGKMNILDDYLGYSMDVYYGDSLGNIVSAQVVNGISASIDDEGDNKGIFKVDGLENGKTYALAVTYTFPNNQKIIVGTLPVTVTSEGQINIGTALIDPYGVVYDAFTKQPLSGANATLYYAKTNTPVTELPLIPGFAPNDNKYSQNTNDNGEYAFMVYPNTDYYIVVTKSGYNSYKTDNIHVGTTLVHNDPIYLVPIAQSGGGGGGTVSGTVNHKPTTKDYNVALQKDTSLSGKIEAKDIDNDKLTFVQLSSPSHGSVLVKSDGTWIYVPNKKYVGTDGFMIKVNDGKGGSAISVVDIVVKDTIASINTPTEVPNYNVNTNINEAVNGKVDPKGNSAGDLSYTVGSEPIHGTVKLNGDGTWDYKPNLDYTGSDSFTINVSDSKGQIGESTIKVDVKGDQKPIVKNAGKAEYQLPKTGEVLDSKALSTLGGALIGVGYLLTGRRKRKK